MQKLMTQLKKNEGYVSIETILVAGLIIVLGLVLILKFSDSTKKVSDQSQINIKTVTDAQNDEASKLLEDLKASTGN